MKMGAGGIIMKQENGGNVQYNGKNFKTIDDDPDMGLGNKKCLQKDYYCGSHRVYLSEEDVKIKKCLCKPDVNMIGYHVCPNLKKMEEIMYRAGREKIHPLYEETEDEFFEDEIAENMVSRRLVSLDENGDYYVSIHACVTEDQRDMRFQWYIADSAAGLKKSPIDSQVYENITISSETIREKYNGKWLGCRCDLEGKIYEIKRTYLTENFVDLIKTCQYQEITFYGKNGMLRDDVKYKDN